ncbi:hypothetical protein P344_02985 [Spiroplasma mirum ATCC 29335]|uniref:Uncharacterized protein n=1 Tax=Spiroplasma mirum ATCC 29335 TaxID=838561 RepID=W0GPC8_9MOLU|nr:MULTISPECIES: hypothetical protein [Spiroplasma]AHF60933.1 hypothetical protein SMM_0504 [Spiroplasma mirum ATCC 29335]AHI57941.1 hypothetical protein P344_02985 [Spiroplasma mirum ATCC 29335]AKM53042.1 hypothetical protein SATRI_v1c05610 [Spiroplasma atrichopogonis]
MKKIINLLMSLIISGVMTVSSTFKNQHHSHDHNSLKAFNQHLTKLGKFTFNKTKISDSKVVTYEIGNNKDLYYLDLTNPTNPISKLLFKNLGIGMYEFVLPNDNILIGYQIGVFPSALQYFDLTDVNHPIIKNLNFTNHHQPVLTPLKIKMNNINEINNILPLTNNTFIISDLDNNMWYLKINNSQPELSALHLKGLSLLSNSFIAINNHSMFFCSTK